MLCCKQTLPLYRNPVLSPIKYIFSCNSKTKCYLCKKIYTNIDHSDELTFSTQMVKGQG